MKARLINKDGQLQLLLATGEIKNVSLADARRFLEDYDDPLYYKGASSWDYEMSMDSVPGKTLATVTEDGILSIFDKVFFKAAIDTKMDSYLTVGEYAEKHGKQIAIVRKHCLDKRIPGVILKGNVWFIPEDAPYPKNSRNRKK